MKTIACIIADDEPIARQILEGYIKEIPYLKITASCKNAFEVMEVLQREEIDLLFLDINMPKLTGLSLLKTLRQKPNVIITTAYPEYAVEGFELEVVDYLLKPFSLERFLQAVMKVRKKDTALLQATVAPAEQTDPVLFIKSDKKIIRLPMNTIRYVEAYGNYIKIYAPQMLLTAQTLTEFLGKLPSQYLRAHKSFVVNFDYLKLIDGNQIVLQDDTKLSIGKSYRKKVLEYIESY